MALLGIKKWLPSMVVKKMGKFQNKMVCKWTSLNASVASNSEAG